MSPLDTIFVTANSAWNLANFRAPILRALVAEGYRVVAVAPADGASERLEGMGVEFVPLKMDPRGLSPVADARLVIHYRRMLKRIRPAAILSFTPKANIYASIAARMERVPVINTVTGLGTGFLTGRLLKSVVTMLYRFAFRRSTRVFFHNCEDLDLFVKLGLVKRSQAALIAGSGVDLQHFLASPKRDPGQRPTFLFIGRMLRDKGVVEFAEAARFVAATRDCRFQVLGPIEMHPKAVAPEMVKRWQREGLIEFRGAADDVRPFIAACDCVVLPSYREGLPRVLLEASAMGRPVIATDVPGCRQAVEDGVTGLLCAPRSAASLAQAMVAFLDMPVEQRSAIGRNARAKAEREFSEAGVVAAYLDAIDAHP